MKQTATNFWNNRWLLIITAGILLGLSFPPFPFPFLQFPAFLLILRVINLANSPKQAAYYTYPGFLIWNIISTYWLMMATIPAGIAAIVANALLMSLTAMLIYWAQQKLTKPWLIAILQSCFWVGYEYLHFQWDLAWPWLTLGNAWSTFTSLIQYISVTGVMGVSAWAMLVTTLGYQAIQHRSKSLSYSAIALVIILPVISLIQLSTLSLKSNKTVEVVTVQPNFNTYKQYGGFATPQQALSLLLNLSDSARTPDTDLILWPENGIYPYITDRKNPRHMVRVTKQRIFSKAKNWNTVIIGGTSYFDYFYRQAPPLAQSSTYKPYLNYNAAIAFYPNGTTEIYRKHNLVPVVERLPFVNFFNTIDVFNWLNWAKYQGFGQGNKATVFGIDSTKVPALICYDSVYPGWIRHFAQKNAGFITIITNDGWWGNSSGHIQHFKYARLAAIEFRKWIVRSANNGISGIITPDGTVKVKTEYWTRTAFHYKVPVLTEATFYARFGNWLPIGMLIIAIGSWGYIYFFRS